MSSKLEDFLAALESNDGQVSSSTERTGQHIPEPQQEKAVQQIRDKTQTDPLAEVNRIDSEKLESDPLPARRCPACNGWLFGVSIYDKVTCAACHPPAKPS